MKRGLTQIAIVLDRSGSMGSVREATIISFNEFIEGQKAVPGEALVSLIQFDSHNPFEMVFDRKDVKDSPKLSYETFVPRGGTPLHDAIGRTIDDLGAKLFALKEEDRPQHVVFVILTDGMENASKEYRSFQIADMIEHQSDTYNWQFIFLGANQDAILTGERLNISASSSLTYNATPRAIQDAVGLTSSKINRMRAGLSKFVEFDKKDRKKVM